jgi:NADP-dependent 3-hydroxy-3-methylglutaryl-CoA reductase
VATFKAHGVGILPGVSSKAAFLEQVAWPDKSDGYTHCLNVVARDDACLKGYLHSDVHINEWGPTVKDWLQGIVVFDSELNADTVDAIRRLNASPSGLCATEALPAAPAPTSACLAAVSVVPPEVAPGPAACLEDPGDFAQLSDADVVALVRGGKLKDHELESKLKNFERAVLVRRTCFEQFIGRPLAALPFKGYCYDQVFGANCEVVVGYVPLPCGVVGPLLLDGISVLIPMATTEGCLVASTNRGAKAITQSGGAQSVVVKDGITRAPLLLMPSAVAAAHLKLWVEDPEHWERLRAAFEATTSFGKLKAVHATVAGRNVFVRFVCFSGDAMGMNMVSKGCLAVIDELRAEFPEMRLVAISGNLCCDKKPAAVNWIEGRGKSVVCEAVISAEVVEKTLKTSVAGMVEVAMRKNLVGSAMAGSVGGFNAHAANIVAAVFLASGQDPAQVVESANCITLAEALEDGSLHISVTMPSIEVLSRTHAHRETQDTRTLWRPPFFIRLKKYGESGLLCLLSPLLPYSPISHLAPLGRHGRWWHLVTGPGGVPRYYGAAWGCQR